LGLGAYEYCLVAEQLSRGWMSVESLIARGSGLIGVLAGLPPQKEEDYLPRVARIVFPGAFFLSELSAGSNVANCSCPRGARRRRVGLLQRQILVHIGHAAG
jgi:alkylation response protein AidB-like acyl-CoA dehydrogenase